MPIPLQSDFDATQLRSFARKTKDGPQARRLLALASIYDGATRTAAAKIGGLTLQIVRDWKQIFSTIGGELRSRKSGDRRIIINLLPGIYVAWRLGVNPSRLSRARPLVERHGTGKCTGPGFG
jgi:hypothetical protein